LPAQGQIELQWRTDFWNDRFEAFFSSLYILGPNTTHDANAGNIVLTQAAPAQAGKLFYRRRTNIDVFDASFKASFGVRTSMNGGGADGIVFVFAPVAEYTAGGGGSLNFDGCLGYGVEFDTYMNTERSDPSEEHIGIIQNVSSNHLHTVTLVPTTLKNGGMHDILIRFRNGAVQVWLNGVLRLTHFISGYTPLDGYFGVTSACGAAFNEHRIDDMRVSMPWRGMTDFGTLPFCDTVVVDTFLYVRNNHPDRADFTITEMTLESVTPDVFSFPVITVPSVIPAGGRVQIPLRIRIPAEGSYQAVLRMDADNGETLLDTLRISAATPQLAWSVPELHGSPQQLASTRDTVVQLRNIGIVAADVLGFHTSTSAVTVMSPTSFPQRISPGESIAVTLRLQALIGGLLEDSVSIVIDCGIAPSLHVHVTGVVETALLHFTSPALMLRPNDVGVTQLFVDSLPRYTPLMSIDGSFEYDRDIIRFEGITALDGGTVAATFRATESIPGIVEFSIEYPSPIISGTAVAGFRFSPLVLEMRCEELHFIQGTGNAGSTIHHEIPVFCSDGRVCINASCRHPDGIRLALPPTMKLYPNPFSTRATVLLTLSRDEHVRLLLRSTLGERLMHIREGTLSEGTHSITIDADQLPAGMYFLELAWDDGFSISPVILYR